MRLAFFCACGLLSGGCGVALIAMGNWPSGLLQLVLTACFPTLYQASKL